MALGQADRIQDPIFQRVRLDHHAQFGALLVKIWGNAGFSDRTRPAAAVLYRGPRSAVKADKPVPAARRSTLAALHKPVEVDHERRKHLETGVDSLGIPATSVKFTSANGSSLRVSSRWSSRTTARPVWSRLVKTPSNSLSRKATSKKSSSSVFSRF